MLDPQKIAMGRVRQAYGLNANEVEKGIQTLWPGSVFPMELWQKVHETYWRSFANSNQTVYNIESPALPVIDQAAKYFYPHLCAIDVQNFFRKLSLNIQSKILQDGLTCIFQEIYEDTDSAFSEERDFLFSTLSRLEAVDIYDQYSPDSELFEEKILSLPISSYHFISKIYPETVVVQKIPAIHYWSVVRGYPLKEEVKGITRALVDSVIKASPQEEQPAHKSDFSLEESTADNQLKEQGGMTLIPRALWEGKDAQQVCDDMRVAGYTEDAPIAHALYYWLGIKNFTEIGTILRGDGITDSARHKHARKHWKLAEGRYYTE